MKVYVYYKESYYGGEIIMGQEDCDYPNKEDTYVKFKITKVVSEKVHEKLQNYYYEEFEVPDDWEHLSHLHILLVKYRDGDTFGCSFGNGSIEGVFDSIEKISEEKLNIEKDYSISQQRNYKPKYKSPNGYNCWNGYFSLLESVNIVTMPFIKDVSIIQQKCSSLLNQIKTRLLKYIR